MPTETNRSPRILANIIKRMKDEDEPLRALIDEYLMKRLEARERYDGHAIDMQERPRPNGRLSPSSLYHCQRQAVMKFAGVKGRRRIDPDQELLFEDGNWRHHKWQFLFYDMELVLGRDRFQVVSIEQFVVIPQLYVAGSLDAEIRIFHKDKWRTYIVDFKGVNDRGFRWITQTDEGKEENIRQVQAYMKARKKKRGILLYDNKNDNKPLTYTVDFSGQLWDETVAWIEQVLNLLEDKRMPPKSAKCRPGTMMYDGCPFRRVCWRSDRVDLQKLTFGKKSGWQGIDEAWSRGLAIYGQEFL